MKDLATHCALFGFIACAIVVMSTFFGEPSDRTALRMLPKRFIAFVGGCLVVAAILLVIESTVAAVH